MPTLLSPCNLLTVDRHCPAEASHGFCETMLTGLTYSKEPAYTCHAHTNAACRTLSAVCCVKWHLCIHQLKPASYCLAHVLLHPEVVGMSRLCMYVNLLNINPFSVSTRLQAGCCYTCCQYCECVYSKWSKSPSWMHMAVYPM